MRIIIPVELQPFTVPHYVLYKSKLGSKSEGFVETPKIPVRELDIQTLDSLCKQFREDIFKKAGKTPPHPIRREHD